MGCQDLLGQTQPFFFQGLECRPADTRAAPCRKPAGWSPWSLRILWLYMIEIPPLPTVYKAYIKGTPEVSWILKADRIKSVQKWLGDVERASILQRILKSWGFHMWSGWADHGSVRDRWGVVQVSDCMRIQHNLFSVVNLCSTPGRCPRCIRNYNFIPMDCIRPGPPEIRLNGVSQAGYWYQRHRHEASPGDVPSSDHTREKNMSSPVVEIPKG